MASEDPKPTAHVNLDRIYEPITTVETLVNYSREFNKDSCKTEPCIEKTTQLSDNFNRTKVKSNGERLQSSSCPKLLVCHDFRGGYLDDKFVNGTSNPDNYTFRHWLQTDLFVYFAHKFVTIPPLGWINCAHSHGVKILGTLITEWTDGELICKELLKDSESIEKAVEKLTWVNEDFGFDGYLINIENPIENGTEKLVEFVDKLTKSLRKSSSNNSVIWYDSVTSDGALKWQDELNEKNKLFFDVCDGIYLNYGWNDEKLQNSVKLAGERKFDVFVGVDVFGRGCFGGGGLNTCKAVEKIACHELSFAIFAPGWTFETCTDLAEYSSKDDEMWDKCARYFYFSCWNENFSRGYGQNFFQLGEKTQNKPWFNLSQQSYQPLLYNLKWNSEENINSNSNVYYETSTGCFGGGCIRLKNEESYFSPLSEFQLESSSDYQICIPLDISLKIPFSNVSKETDTIAVLIIWKKSERAAKDRSSQLKVCLEIDPGEEVGIQRVELGSNFTNKPNFFNEEITLRKFLPKTLSAPPNIDFNEIIFASSDTSTCKSQEEFDGWNLTCNLYQSGSNNWNSLPHKETETLNAVLLGSVGDICIGFLSIAKIPSILLAK